MFRIIITNKYDRDLTKCAKRGLDLDLLEEVVDHLRKEGVAPLKHRPHILSGKLQGIWECHIKSDWLLLWLTDEDEKTITLINTGTHSDFFK